jgi:thymidylate kinase
MKARPVIVEFAGLPGAGKTTVARQVLPELRTRGYRCGDRDLIRGRTCGQERVPYGGLGQFYLSQHAALRSALRLGLSAAPYNGARVREVLKLLLWSYRLSVVRETRHDVVVLDQGVVQQGWTTMVRGECWDEKAVRDAVSTMLLSARVPVVLVYVNVGVHVAVDRMQSRPTMRSSYDRMSREDAIRRLDLHQRRLTTIFQHAAADTGAPHLTVDGSRPAAESCDKVVELVDVVTRAAEVSRPKLCS